MAHIRRHPVDRSKWQVRHIDPAGRERSRIFRRKVDAEKFLIHVEAQKQRAEWIDPELAATLLADFAGPWLATRSHLKPRTLETYEGLLRVHIVPAFGGTRLDRIDTMSIETWIAELLAGGLSPRQVRKAHQVLRQILSAAVKARHLPSNPAMGIKLQELTRREQLFLEPAGVDRLAEVVPAEYKTWGTRRSP